MDDSLRTGRAIEPRLHSPFSGGGKVGSCFIAGEPDSRCQSWHLCAHATASHDGVSQTPDAGDCLFARSLGEHEWLENGRPSPRLGTDDRYITRPRPIYFVGI